MRTFACSCCTLSSSSCPYTRATKDTDTLCSSQSSARIPAPRPACPTRALVPQSATRTMLLPLARTRPRPHINHPSRPITTWLARTTSQIVSHIKAQRGSALRRSAPDHTTDISQKPPPRSSKHTPLLLSRRAPSTTTTTKSYHTSRCPVGIGRPSPSPRPVSPSCCTRS